MYTKGILAEQKALWVLKFGEVGGLEKKSKSRQVGRLLIFHVELQVLGKYPAGRR